MGVVPVALPGVGKAPSQSSRLQGCSPWGALVHNAAVIATREHKAHTHIYTHHSTAPQKDVNSTSAFLAQKGVPPAYYSWHAALTP